MKYYLAVIEMIEWSSTHKLFSTKEKARDFLYAEIGAYIANCIEHGATDEAIDFIKSIHIENTEDTVDYFCVDHNGKYDEYYIEEIELDV